ncbi:site-specific integrase [Alloalcanivorax xenomutans]
MPKPRSKRENRPLPERWEWHGNKISYQIPPKLAGHPAFEGRRRRITLGATLTEAHRRWIQIQEHFDNPVESGFMKAAHEYQRVELPTLAGKTQRDYRQAIARLIGAFQEFDVSEILPHHCYAYVDDNLHRVRQARYDIRVLSSILSWCVVKGILPLNPLIKQVKFRKKKYNPKKKTHYVTNDDMIIFLKQLARKWQLYVLIKLKTGQSQQSLLTTKLEHIKPEGIDFNRKKTDVDIPIEWDDDLREYIDEMMAMPRKSEYLWETRNGDCYYDMEVAEASGFRSMWRRAQLRAMKAGMSARFMEHELRHKATSDNDLEEASAALGHADIRITREIYQLVKKRSKPLGISDDLKTTNQ